MENSKDSLKDILAAYGASGVYPFHMPGHKRNMQGMPEWNIWQIDVTEVEGTDNLHQPEGILREAMERAAGAAGADRSYFLVNGSTGGILSAVAAVVKPGDTVLVARNCHKSVYHAVFLNHLHAVYVQPEWIDEYHMAGGIDPQKVERLLSENPQIRAVILTSPTYEGMVSDIGQIAELVHRRRIPLIVDEAHGAHFNLKYVQADDDMGDQVRNPEYFPVSAVRKGADIVIQSTHKTLPALTQTGLLHVSGRLVDRERLEQFLGIYQTSSPSYVLMSSIDYAVNFLEHEQALMAAYGKRLLSVREEINQLTYLRVAGRELVGKAAVYDVDNSRLLLSVCGKRLSGKELYELLRIKYGLQCEMAMENYTLAMTSVMDTEEGYGRLVQALQEIDRELGRTAVVMQTEDSLSPEADALTENTLQENVLQEGGEVVMTIAEAFYVEKKLCPRQLAAGKISGEYLYLYPPGVPFLVPGERISMRLLERIERLEKQGFEIQGLSDETKNAILVINAE